MKSNRFNLNLENKVTRCTLLLVLLGFISVMSNGVLAHEASANNKETTGYFLGADNNKMFYRELGTADETIIFLHGGPGFDLTDGGYELDALAHNYRLIGYDQRGSGYSAPLKDPAQLSTAHHVQDIEAIRKHFNLDQFTLMGISWGSGLAMLYADKYPQHVKRMVFLAPMPISYAMTEYRMMQTDKLLTPTEVEAFKAAREADLSNATDQQIIANCRIYIPIAFKPYRSPQTKWQDKKGDYCGTDPQGLKRRWSNNAATMKSLVNFNWVQAASNYAGPVYILEGSLSSVPLNTTREWAGYLSNSRVEFLKQSGHVVWIDRPEIVVKNIELFMQGHWPKNAHVLNPTHINLLARYGFEHDIANDMDNRFDAVAPTTIGYGRDRFGNHNSTAVFSQPDDKLVVAAPGWTAYENNWSWTGWFKFDVVKASPRSLLSQGDKVKLEIVDKKLRLNVAGLQVIDSSAVASNQWHHVGVVQAGNGLKLYRNGQLVAAGSSPKLAQLSGDFTMQNHGGELDDIRIYAGALTERQVRAVYHQMND